MIVPGWFQKQLTIAHPTLVVRWEYFKPQKQFILPYHGVPFFRWEENGTVWYKRFGLNNVPKELRSPYQPDPEHRPSGCFVVRQPRPSIGDLSTVFDVIDEDGGLLPLDQRVLDAIGFRKDDNGDRWKEAERQVDENEAKAGDEKMGPVRDQLEETAFEAFKQATGIKTIAVAGNASAKKSFESFTVVDKRRFTDAGNSSNGTGKNP